MGAEVMETKFCPRTTPCVSLSRASRKLNISTDALLDLAKRGVITLHPTPSGQYELSTGEMMKALAYQSSRKR